MSPRAISPCSWSRFWISEISRRSHHSFSSSSTLETPGKGVYVLRGLTCHLPQDGSWVPIRWARRRRPRRARSAGRARCATLVAPERVGVGLLAGLLELLLDGRQRRRDVLEVALRGLDAHGGLDDAADDHHRGADHVADEDLVRVTALDERAEQQRAAEAADDRAGRVEERDRHRPRLHREDLADGEVRGAGARGREEEDDAPG